MYNKINIDDKIINDLRENIFLDSYGDPCGEIGKSIIVFDSIKINNKLINKINMKNFPIKDEKIGKEYWISRAIAVVTFVFAVIDKKLCVLANKRGSGTPDYQGCWNCPCGYLDFDETLKQAAAREVFEETGVSICDSDLKFINYNDDIDEGKQNVTFRFGIVLEDYIYKTPEISERGGENNEVSEIKWIPIEEISKYKWAFNHEQIILDILCNKLSSLFN